MMYPSQVQNPLRKSNPPTHLLGYSERYPIKPHRAYTSTPQWLGATHHLLVLVVRLREPLLPPRLQVEDVHAVGPAAALRVEALADEGVGEVEVLEEAVEVPALDAREHGAVDVAVQREGEEGRQVLLNDNIVVEEDNAVESGEDLEGGGCEEEEGDGGINMRHKHRRINSVEFGLWI